MKRFEIKDKKDTRSGFGVGLLEAARKNPKIVALCADLTGSVKMDGLKKEFPERFYQAGIAEANMASVAAGMATAGMVPFIGTFANFATTRILDQIRQSIAYANTNVKIAGSHAGVTLGEDGATHQVMEDLGQLKMLPNMTVINPCDFNQTKLATIAAAEMVGPVYLRFGRPVVPVFTDENYPFEIGKGIKMIEGSDVTIIATGHLVWEAVLACEELEEKGISVELINIHTIKPLDKEMILESVSKTGCVVTAEEHFMNGGLGDSVAQLLALNAPAPLEMVAVDDKFGQSGTPSELLEKYGLNSSAIVEKVAKVMSRKK
ncbi:MAG: transketolase C-terminal domain-containing protein [Rikenellaceae bacterium]